MTSSQPTRSTSMPVINPCTRRLATAFILAFIRCRLKSVTVCLKYLKPKMWRQITSQRPEDSKCGMFHCQGIWTLTGRRQARWRKAGVPFPGEQARRAKEIRRNTHTFRWVKEGGAFTHQRCSLTSSKLFSFSTFKKTKRSCISVCWTSRPV